MRALALSALLLTAGLVACGSPAPAPAPEATPAPAVAGRTVEVFIDGNGYTPDRIEARPMEALTLVFHREDANNCGEVVQFPDHPQIAKVEVPVGKPTSVTLTAPATGELAFTCGMAMYEGAVVVAQR